jgi:hypothetical protein
MMGYFVLIILCAAIMLFWPFKNVINLLDSLKTYPPFNSATKVKEIFFRVNSLENIAELIRVWTNKNIPKVLHLSIV